MLTAKRVARLLRQPGRYSDGRGLLLVVTNPRNARWVFRYQRDGRERWLGLGPTHLVSLADARRRAWDARRQLLDDIDPLAAKRAAQATAALAAAKTMTFADAGKAYFLQHARAWKSKKHKAQFVSQLESYAVPVLGRLSVADIDTGLVLKVLEPIWPSKTQTASRVRAHIERVLDWAQVRGLRSGDNPARWKGHLAEVLPAPKAIAKTKHHAALPYARVGQFLLELQERRGPAARALEFLILTAARTSEVIGARWDEIDGNVWTVPAARMKMGKEHRVPLSERACKLLRNVYREAGNDFIFIGPKEGAGISDMAMAMLMERMKCDVTVHGFRSTFRDWAAERTSFPNHVVEMALAHAVAGVEGAYRRGDLFAKRRQLMDAWAAYCAMPAAGEVVPLRRSRR